MKASYAAVFLIDLWDLIGLDGANSLLYLSDFPEFFPWIFKLEFLLPWGLKLMNQKQFMTP